MDDDDAGGDADEEEEPLALCERTGSQIQDPVKPFGALFHDLMSSCIGIQYLLPCVHSCQIPATHDNGTVT